jgi:hypothetical protein
LSLRDSSFIFESYMRVLFSFFRGLVVFSTTAIVSCRYGYTPLAESELHGPGGSAGIGFDSGGTPFSGGSSSTAAGGLTSSGGESASSGAPGIGGGTGNAGSGASGGAGVAGASGSAAFAGSGGTSGGTGAGSGGAGAGSGGAASGGAGSGGAGSGGAASGGAASGGAASGGAASGGAGACGNLVAPALPASFDGFSVDSVSLNGGGGALALAPGASFTIDLGYTAVDSACPTCQDQLEIGFDVGGLVSFCAFSTVVGATPIASSGSFQMTAPSTPGLYKLRFGKGQQFVCTGVADDCGQRKNAPSCGAYWSPPAGNGDIGVVCVQ